MLEDIGSALCHVPFAVYHQVTTNVCTIGETFRMPSMILVGDVNLMNVADPAVPFARIGDELRAADLVFANLECCLYQPPDVHAVEHEGFFADPDIAGAALGSGGIAAVGLANNVNYGTAEIGRAHV